MSGNFKHFDLQIIAPDFDSQLTDLILNLDHLRRKKLEGTTHPAIFFQLKGIFHILESIGSARIEGNHTTIAEYIESKLEPEASEDEKIREIRNIEEAMNFIDDNIEQYPINRAFLREIHKLVVKNLGKEGSKTPGEYRKKNLEITQSAHKPPDFVQVENYMEEMFRFIEQAQPVKYDLLKTAQIHHRFVWIHPFDNGNGRVVRLLTYAMLVKQGFNIKQGRILNPTAVFCNDREKYYTALSWADQGNSEGILQWCSYVLEGLKIEIEKIDKLLNYSYLDEQILTPSIKYSLDRQVITLNESEILKIAAKIQLFQARDVKNLFPGKLPQEISRILRSLKEKKMIVAAGKQNARKYTLRFDNNYLLRGVIKMLGDKGFLPLKE